MDVTNVVVQLREAQACLGRAIGELESSGGPDPKAATEYVAEALKSVAEAMVALETAGAASGV